jgi:hypothetical protein
MESTVALLLRSVSQRAGWVGGWGVTGDVIDRLVTLTTHLPLQSDKFDRRHVQLPYLLDSR